jgi:hypothetical protein
MFKKLLAVVIVLSLLVPVLLLASGAQSAAAGADKWTKAAERGIDGDYTMYPSQVASTASDATNLYIGASAATGFAIWRTDGTSWTRIAKEGLGNRSNTDADSMCFYQGKLFVGTGRHGDPTGTSLYTWDGSRWTTLTNDFYGQINNKSLATMTVFEGKLYVGTFNPYDGAQIWSFDGAHWTQVNVSGFDGDPFNTGVDFLTECGGALYAAVRNNSTGCRLFRYAGGTTWDQVGDPGFGDKDNNLVTALYSFGTDAGDFIVMGTHYEGTTGCQVWLYGKDGDTFTQLVNNGFGADENVSAASIEVYDFKFYIGTFNEQGFQVWTSPADDLHNWTNATTGGLGRYAVVMQLNNFNGKLWGCMGAQGGPPMRVFTTVDGAAWTAAASPGWIQHYNWSAESLATYRNKLYAGTMNTQTGAEIWRKDESGWTPVMTGGFGRTEIIRVSSMAEYGDCLYAGTEDLCTVYRYDGSTWTQVSLAGFGNARNHWVSSMVAYNGYLYVGTGGDGGASCEVLRYDGSSWSRVNVPAFGSPSYDGVQLAVHQGRLFAGTTGSSTYTGQVFRYESGTTWTPVSTPGLGIKADVTTLTSCNGKLYAGLYRHLNQKTYVYRWDGPGASDWVPVMSGSFGGGSTRIISAAAFDGKLYMGTDRVDDENGAQVWRYDGSGWTQSNENGWGSALNMEVRSMVVSGNTLSAGVYNEYYGAEIEQTGSSQNFYFAEGTTRPGFDPYFTIANPSDAAAQVTVDYMLGNGKAASQVVTVKAHARGTVHPADILGSADDPAHDFAAQARCLNGKSVVVERPMYFDYQGMTGGSDVIGVTAPASTFYFAEGTTRPGFDTYITIANPGSTTADVTLTYMKGNGQTFDQRMSVPQRSRATVHPADSLGIGDDATHDFSTRVTCTNGQQIVAERPSYFDYKGWSGGTDVMGATSPSSTFYFAEGTTRPGFEPYFCIQNPGGSLANVSLTYMRGDGTSAVQNVGVSAHSRATVRPGDILGTADDAAHDFSTTVTCAGGQQVLVERPMYFDYHGWSGGSDVVGAVQPATTFSFAEGTTRPGFETYFTLGNPTGAAATVRLSYMRGDGALVYQNVMVAAGARATVRASDVLGSADDATHDFSMLVQSTNGVPIVAERPMYFDYRGWTGGHDVVGFTP